MTVEVGILHTDWLMLLAIGGGISGIGLLGFLYDWRKTNNITVVLLFLGSFLLTLATLLVGQQDFMTATGPVTYQSEYWLIYVLYPWALISWMVSVVSTIVLIVSWRNKRSQTFGKFSTEY